MPGFPVLHYSQSLLELTFIEPMMLSNHLTLCCLLLLLSSIFPRVRVFSNESALCIRWLKYWSFSFSISPSNEHSGLISFKIDWFDLLAVQWTLKSLLQHHSSKASILRCSAFFMVQLSHPYMTTRKTIALTRHTTSAFLPWEPHEQYYCHFVPIENCFQFLFWLIWKIICSPDQPHTTYLRFY